MPLIHVAQGHFQTPLHQFDIVSKNDTRRRFVVIGEEPE